MSETRQHPYGDRYARPALHRRGGGGRDERLHPAHCEVRRPEPAPTRRRRRSEPGREPCRAELEFGYAVELDDAPQGGFIFAGVTHVRERSA